MSEPLTGSERDALGYLYGGGDEQIECRSTAWVTTRYKQKCVSVLHKGTMTMPSRTHMILERAKVEGRFGSCYTCEPCIRKAEQELNSKED
jgi:hypothetical protein